MKNKLIRVAVFGALATGMIFAQNGSPDPAQTATRQQKKAKRGSHAGRRMANVLNLSADQRAQAQQILAGARQEAAPLRQQMQQNRKALADAIKSGNDAQIDQITRAEAPVKAQLVAIHARAMGKIYATLTPEQKAKADHMRRFVGHAAGGRRKLAG
jgi:Spy/CpxP family protein refolding chaperone